MPRSYRHIQDYEKEILELRSQGLTLKEIGGKYGVTFKQLHNFFTRYNKKQQMLASGVALKRKGRPPKDYVVSEQDKIAELKYIIARKKIQTYEEDRLLIDEYIYFYNNQRIQLKTKLTPLEKRSQYVA